MDDPIISLSARTSTEEEEQARGTKGREGGRGKSCGAVSECSLRRGHYPDTFPISPWTSESRSDRRPNLRVILSNPKGAPWGSVQIGNLFLMSPLIPGPANGVAYPRLMVVFTHQPSLLEDLAELSGQIRVNLFRWSTLLVRCSSLYWSSNCRSRRSSPIKNGGRRFHSAFLRTLFRSSATDLWRIQLFLRQISVVCDGRFRYWTVPSSESALCVR